MGVPLGLSSMRVLVLSNRMEEPRGPTYPPCHLSFRTAIRDYLWDGRGRRKERSMRRVGHLRWVLLGSLSLLVTSGHDLPPKKRRIAVSRQRLTRRRSPRENQEVGSKRSCPSRTSLFLDLWVVTATKITCQAVRTQRKKKSSRNKISYPPSGSSPQGILHH